MMNAFRTQSLQLPAWPESPPTVITPLPLVSVGASKAATEARADVSESVRVSQPMVVGVLRSIEIELPEWDDSGPTKVDDEPSGVHPRGKLSTTQLAKAQAAKVFERPAGLTTSPSLAPSPCFAPPLLEASVALHSDDCFWEDLDGRLGVFVATYDSHDVGTKVWVDVHLPGGVTFGALAKVQWVREASQSWPGLGLRFLCMESHDHDAVRTFLRCRPPLLF